MILWTVQDVRVWQRVRDGETYTTDESHILFPGYEDDDANHCNHAYLWLADKMRERVGEPPEGVRYPVWAWYKRQGQHDGKPDMRRWKAEPDSEEVVRMRLDVPDWEVLLSDFDDWHSVLNYWPSFETKEEYDDYDKMLEDLGIDWLDVSNWSKTSEELARIRRTVEESWESTLGVRRGIDDYCSHPWPLRTIQATFWELKPEYVVSVEKFKANH